MLSKHQHELTLSVSLYKVQLFLQKRSHITNYKISMRNVCLLSCLSGQKNYLQQLSSNMANRPFFCKKPILQIGIFPKKTCIWSKKGLKIFQCRHCSNVFLSRKKQMSEQKIKRRATLALMIIIFIANVSEMQIYNYCLITKSLKLCFQSYSVLRYILFEI